MFFYARPHTGVYGNLNTSLHQSEFFIHSLKQRYMWYYFQPSTAAILNQGHFYLAAHDINSVITGLVLLLVYYNVLYCR